MIDWALRYGWIQTIADFKVQINLLYGFFTSNLGIQLGFDNIIGNCIDSDLGQ